MKNLFVMAASAAMMFASCAKDGGENQNPNDDSRAVKVRIEYADSDDTRGVGDPVANNTATTFTGGYLLFTDSTDEIKWVVKIESGSVAYDEETRKVGISNLSADTGAEITGVPSSSNKVSFVGNPPAGVTPATLTKLSAYEATVISQYSNGSAGRTPQGGVANVTLFGSGALTAVTGGEANEYEASFNVKPIAARFEIEKITGKHSEAGKTLEYTLTGIFIDNYYDKMSWSGVIAASDLKYNGDVKTRFVLNGAGGSYVTANQNAVFDNAPGATHAVFAPAGTNKVWAYNLLAPIPVTGGSKVMPSIVLKFDNIKVDGTPLNKIQYITIEKFFTDQDRDTVLEELAQGNIYVLDNIEFTEQDFDEIPHEEGITVRVKVSMLKWERKSIGWDF
jgi:hypothetical protein